MIAMRAATYGFTIGKGREFILLAFRRASPSRRSISSASADVGSRSTSLWNEPATPAVRAGTLVTLRAEPGQLAAVGASSPGAAVARGRTTRGERG